MNRFIGSDLDALPTPCLLLEADILETNLRRMQSFVQGRGKRLRAHAKSHKCSQLAQRQVEMGAFGVCAAKISEARGLVEAGLRNVLLTGPVVTTSGHEDLLYCAGKDDGFTAALDQAGNAERVSRRFEETGRRLGSLIDLDVGFSRTGIPLEGFRPLAEELMRLPGLELRGVQAYEGSVQHISSYEERKKANQKALQVASEALGILRELGLEDPILSVGGTGSSEFDCAWPQVTEVQAGSYPLMDVEYLNIGSRENPDRFEVFPPALTVLSRVLSANHRDFVTIDAGLKCLYRDGGVPEVLSPGGGLTYDWFGDEYGKITGSRRSQLQVGDKLRLVAAHCDPTVNLFDHFFVIRAGRVEDVWPIDLRGCSQ